MMSSTPSHTVPEFWKLPRVIEATGLSKSEIYRQMNDGRFPTSRPYKHNPTRKFWVSVEVQRWQAQQIGEDQWADLLG